MAEACNGGPEQELATKSDVNNLGIESRSEMKDLGSGSSDAMNDLRLALKQDSVPVKVDPAKWIVIRAIAFNFVARRVFWALRR